MNRGGSLFWLGLAMSTCVGMFMLKYAVQSTDDELARVRNQIVSEQHEIRVLHAEWSYLTQPERLSEMNKQFLSLIPVATRQLQQTISEIPMRPAPEPAAEMAAAAPQPAAAAAPIPANPVFALMPVALHSGDLAGDVAARPNPPARRLDELFAQIAGER